MLGNAWQFQKCEAVLRDPLNLLICSFTHKTKKNQFLRLAQAMPENKKNIFSLTTYDKYIIKNFSLIQGFIKELYPIISIDIQILSVVCNKDNGLTFQHHQPGF